MLRELGVLFVFCLSACKQRGGKVLRGNAIAARARNKLFQLMARLLHVQAFTCTIRVGPNHWGEVGWIGGRERKTLRG